MEFPCQLLSLVFIEENEHENEQWCLEILTSWDKEDFIMELQAALLYMIEEGDESWKCYTIRMSKTDIPNKDFFDGYLEEKTAFQLLGAYSYKAPYRFVYVSSDELLPVEKLLKSELPVDTVVVERKNIVKLLKERDVLYKNFTNVY